MTPILLSAQEKRALRRVLRLVNAQPKEILLAITLGCLTLGCAIALAATSAWLIARASQQPPVLHLTVAAVSVRMFGVGRALMRYLSRLASHKVAMTGMDELRQGIYATLAHQPLDRVAQLKRGDLLARAGADVDDVGDLVVKALLPTTVTAIVGIGSVVGIAIVSPVSAAILAAMLAVSGVVTPLIIMRATRAVEIRTRQARTALASLSHTLLDNAAELQVNEQLNAVREHLAQAENELTTASHHSARLHGLALAVDRLAMGMAVLGALLVGISQTTAGDLAPVLLAVIVLTPLAAFEGTAELAPAATQLVRSAQAAVRIDALLGPSGGADGPRRDASTMGTPSDMETPTAPEAAPLASLDETTVLQAEKLAVGWPGGPILADDITFTLGPGQTLAIVGPSGIGKTTLLLTLAGILPPRGGEVTVNGHPLEHYQPNVLRRAISVTAEDAHIFATTVLENLRVARPGLDESEAEAILARVGLSEWTKRLPAGLNTVLGAGGTTLSGGERRRLLMARALASNASHLLLDEAGEHLDAATADTLLATLLADTQRSVLVVSHRLSPLTYADEVLVLGKDNSDAVARVVARGTHQELYHNHSAYRYACDQEK
ncbi:thiol reductant ABC exporter subunit CydC [Schaalia suimastitidis]|uniref:thiol reductant ABC exporter subunit CydC n=1 Tax=Schaalia suimastitidis TaxID=121163 RepID=UPI00041EC0C6|nr:thiol reductant ABC exporter subunit CydC [Schaalia suimastitidis]